MTKRSLLLNSIFSLLLFGFAEGALAQFCAPPYPPPKNPPAKQPSCKCQPRNCKKCTTSPAFVGSGVYETDALDLSIPTPGFPLEIARRYSSAHAIDSGTGFGWSSSFHAHLYYASYLFAAPSTYQKEAQIVMPDGEHLRFVETSGGSFTPPEGRYDTLVRNADGSFDLTLQRSRSKMHFSPAGLLTSMTDDYGNELTLTYDTSGRLQRVADAAGSARYLDIYWGANGRISSIQDHSGRIVQYGYDTAGMLTSVTNPANQTTTYSYVTGRFTPVLSRVTDPWGRILSDITWDSEGRLASYSENGETYTYTYGYNAVASDTSKTDSAGNRWVYSFGADGLIGQRRAPGNNGQTSTLYYADGTVQQSTDELGVKTYYTYAGDGRVATVTKDYQGASAVRFDYTYDPDFPEKVLSILPKNPATGALDPNWQGWKYDYYPPTSATPGALHHVYRLRDDGTTLGTSATYTYDAKGRALTTTDANGAVTDYTYDTAGNLASVTAPANNTAGVRPVTTYGYDTLGRVTSVTDPLGKITTYTYDVLDRIATVTLPKPSATSTLVFTSTYSYDNWDATSGLLSTQVTDPNGIVTKQSYDLFGRLRKSIDAANQTTAYGYTRDLLTSITDANGNTTTYQYDILRRLSSTTFPDGARETYGYRLDGLLTYQASRKNEGIYYDEYDAHKRLKVKRYLSTGTITYTYTGQKLTQVTDTESSPSETHTFAYDSAFRVTSNTQATRGTITYSYLGANEAVATMAVTGGPTTSYSYFADGSLSTINWSPVSGAFQYVYNANGQYQSLAMPNGQSRGFSYDDQGRLLQIANTHPTAGNLATFDYGYDLNHATSAYTRMGQRVSMTANVPAQSLSAAQTKYHYDPSYQLTRAEYPAVAPFNGEVHDWSYDAIGNRLTSAMNGGAAINYTYQKIGTNPNNWQRMLTAGGPTHTYDANGRTTSDGVNTYGWDYENRMKSITGSVSATYKYDYQGRRTSKTVAGTTTTYLYDGLNLIAEAGATPTDYVFGPVIDEPLALSRGGNVSYYSVDGLGSVSLVSDPSGTVQNHYQYDGWGTQRAVTETVPQPFRYTSRELGDAAGQWFYRARFYSPPIGRFLSEDPIASLFRELWGSNQRRRTSRSGVKGSSDVRTRGTASAQNPHIYTDNMPVLFRDPKGLTKCSIYAVSKTAEYVWKGGPGGKTQTGCAYSGQCGNFWSVYFIAGPPGCPCPDICTVDIDLASGISIGPTICRTTTPWPFPGITPSNWW